MDLSVIIPTFNGAHRIRETLMSLAIQTLRDFEVIVVVDGSTDQTVSEVRELKSHFLDLSIVEIQNRGRAGARNAGASAATGKVLIFVDDDVRLFENAIALHHQFHLAHSNSMVFGHLEMDPAKAKLNDFWEYRRAIESSWRLEQSLTISFENYAFTSANMSIHHKAFNDIGGFDAELRDSEDFDFSVRALRQGISIQYNPELRGFHDDFSSLHAYVIRQREYLSSKYLLLIKHPEYEKWLPSQFLWTQPRLGDGIKRLIFFSSRFWMTVLNSRVFHSLPRRVRYLLYSLYIYVQSGVTKGEMVRNR